MTDVAHGGTLRPSREWRERTEFAPLDAGGAERLRAALSDIAEGMTRWRAWSYLAMEAIRNQYRRTVLGPWWLTLQTAAYVVGLAVIFSQLLHSPLKTFLPYVALGFICFGLLAGMTRAGAHAFTGAAGTMKSTRQPLSSLVLRDMAVEFIQFGHNMLIFVVFVAAGMVPLRLGMLVAIPILLLIAVNGFFAALWLGPTVARFRDVGPLVMSLLQVLMFFTPVFYKLQDLHIGSRRALLGWNPFTYLLMTFRGPLISEHVAISYFVGAGVVTLANVLLGLAIFAHSRSRLPYWVT